MNWPRINGLTFDYFSSATEPVKTPIDKHPISFWTNGLVGEVAEYVEAVLDVVFIGIAAGKLANAAKKLERDQPWEEDVVKQLEGAMLKEGGDVLFYLDKSLKKRSLTINHAAVACIHKLDRMREAR